MPPANSPTETPPVATAETSPYLQQLEVISSPVPNFAATLTAQSEDDANNENISFLRTRPPSALADIPSPIRRLRQPYLIEDASEGMESHWLERFEPQREDRIRRSSDQNHRIRSTTSPYNRNHPTPAPGRDGPPVSFASRILRQQAINDWPPSSDEDEDNDRDELPPSHPFRRHPANREIASETPPHWFDRPSYLSERASNNGAAFANQYNESSVATAALLQSVRRQSQQFSRRNRPYYSNLALDEIRNHQMRRFGPDTEEQRSRFPRPIHPSRYELYGRRNDNPMDSSGAIYSSGIQKQMDNRLKDVLKYLEQVRFCISYEERLATAALAGFVRSDFFCKDTDDFILDTATLMAPQETSWLRDGCVFSGAQHASHGSLLHHREWTSASGRRLQQNPNYSRHNFSSNSDDEGIITISTTSGRSYVARSPSIPQISPTSGPSGFDAIASERWPVRVTLHKIDYDKMEVCGTMEARSIPDKSSPTQESSITTFLEGEIIDFNRHTLQTKSFRSDINIDATYWSRLMPFRENSSETNSGKLLSQKWISEELQGKWVLMRWKERCVLAPSHPRSGLTISGFYYISLNRETGAIEGLYYDPGSTPYQHLSLNAEGPLRTFPAYEMR